MSAPYGSDFASVAALLADRARAAMLTVLLDGRPLSAGELARTAGVSPATASSHLGRLLAGDLVTVVQQGRHRYYRLKSAEIAAVIEALSRIAPEIEVRSLRQSRQARSLRDARTCYDHLAGRAGTALFEAMLDRGLLEPAGPGTVRDATSQSPRDVSYDDMYEVTDKGEKQLRVLSIDVPGLRRARRRFAGHCLDWTERRPHLNGALGAAVTASLIDQGWFERGATRRALVLTEKGRAGLADVFGCFLD